MQSSYLKRLGAVVLGVAVIVGTFETGVRYGANNNTVSSVTSSQILNDSSGQPSSVDFAPFWKAWNILNKDYVPTHSSTTPSNQSRVYGAIQGLTNSFGDPYTVFFPPVEAQDFQSQISGGFSGIGMEVGVKDGILTVIAPLKGSPAERAGIMTGDKILQVGTTSTQNLSVDDAVSMIRGEKGTPITLTLLGTNDKKPRQVTVVRDEIPIPTLDVDTKTPGVFTIHLYSFSANAATLFRSALQQFMRSGDHKLLLDLRGNPGGYLEGAVDMASWFLPSDAVVVKEDTAGHGQDETYNSKGYNVFNVSNDKNFQMIILVDGGSASAAEILSGALQEHGIAKLVGSQTFGKGSVQELIDLTPDTSLKVTVARWLTPHGVSISQHGLTPDYVVPITPEDITAKKDPQLAKALELLGAK